MLPTVRIPAATPVLLPSDSNDTWRIGSVILRVCWRGDRDRFLREAAVTAALPPDVPYPEVLGVGRDDDLAWQLTRALDGVTLADAWPRLSQGQRRDAVHQIGHVLAALNKHRFPADITAVLGAPRPVGDTSPGALIGADLNPLPYSRALLLIAHARGLPHVDPALIADVEARLTELAGIDPLTDADSRTDPSCVHGDAHAGNALWRDGRLVALLDFEWVRLGPPDLEIEPYLRDLRVGDPRTGGPRTGGPRADTAVAGTNGTDRREILGWLAESHPAAFASAHLVERLWLYQLAYTVRELLIRGADRPCHELPDDHPLPVLRRMVSGPEYLREFV